MSISKSKPGRTVTQRTIVEAAVGEWGAATATFSPDRVHRYALTRTWDAGGPKVNFVMLNPSTADAFHLDPTNRRCVGFARAWGFGGIVTTNIFAFRSTDPHGLRTAHDAVGPWNDEHLLAAARTSDVVVAAWGVHGSLHDRDVQVRSLLEDAGVELSMLRVTKGGHPSHPLYLPSVLSPIPWRETPTARE